jgi:putative sterol carrier protein
VVDGERHDNARLTLTADYRRWQQLVRGELDVAMAVMLRRLRVSGDLTSLMGNVSNAQPLVDSLHEVETTWLEDA